MSKTIQFRPIVIQKIGILFLKILLLSIVLASISYSRSDFLFIIGFYGVFISIIVSIVCVIAILSIELWKYLQRGGR